ncbi:hypothetical protein CK503_06735 [Aliifodinibius salipaludis]|uniref:Transposase IS200-like domain-containing protein n=1 Tax=Fodinibius salipaludis TaxID=2032627 RepID=A0A2A2GC79_9BACT|nr:hypothetical protein [Aliifodinibius salipaludis]PAU94487.1 hypothetical protein CK503_06735 [Aliifodinibius salipaludis]
MGNNRESFEPNAIYHVYNHGNAGDLIFREDTNYAFFLKRYQKYIPHIADTFAYCLMPNHFHVMVRVKSREALLRFAKKKYPDRDPQSFENFADLISNQFKNFLISYAKSFNKMYDRKGSLFLDNLNRKSITEDSYYTQLICYIHQNPIKHGFVDNITDWPYSSYHSLLSKQAINLKREEVFKWFGGRENFIQAHKRN